MSSVQPKAPRQFDTLEQASRDIKVLRYLADDSLRVARAAHSNIDTFAAMSRLATRLIAAQSLSDIDKKADLADFKEQIEEMRHKHAAHARTATSLVSQAESILGQVRALVTNTSSEETV
jgi:hypothetical protein